MFRQPSIFEVIRKGSLKELQAATYEFTEVELAKAVTIAMGFPMRCDVLDFLLGEGVNPNKNYSPQLSIGHLFKRACIDGHLEVIKTFIRHGADVNLFFKPAESEALAVSYTPVQILFLQKNFPAMKLLLLSGANLFTTNSNGENLFDLLDGPNDEMFLKIIKTVKENYEPGEHKREKSFSFCR